MVESGSQNKAALNRYLNDKKKAADKNSAKPKSQTTQEKEAIASKVFRTCTRNEWKDVKSIFKGVKELIGHYDITSSPQDFDKLTQDDCRIANSVSRDDSHEGIKTFRLIYDQTESATIYFPIVTKNFELLKDRTISAQENTLLTTHSTNNNSNTNDKELIEENTAHTQTNEDQEEAHEQENVNLEEQPVVDEHMIELEKMADDVANGKPLYPTQNNHYEHHSEENHHEHKDINEVNKDMQELEKMASIVQNGGYIYPLNEHQKEDGDIHNHIQKHNTHNAKTQTHDEEYNLEDLFHDNTDINDHIEAPSHSNKHDLPLLGGDHDVNLLKPTEEDDSMNNITPLFSEFDYDVSPKNTHTSTQEVVPHFHNTDIEDYDFFDQKRRNHKQEHINRLDNNEATDINDVTTSKAQPEHNYSNDKHHSRVGGWSEPKPCSNEEKLTTVAYVTKMTLSGKVLGLLPTTQNIVSCAHQIVAGTNFSVIIEINSNVCEVVYNVDLENIVHDLNKSYAQTKVPCVDMYSRHLF